MAMFKTNDGAHIHYEVTGEGKPLVLMHGWDQSGKAFCENVPVLSQKYKVINVDLRGHGESENVNYGYRISRLSMDVKQLLDYLDLQDVTLLGWSMGCSVLWGYWDLYRNERVSKLIMVDEPPLCLVNESNPDGFADNDACVDLKRRILTETEAAAKDFTSMMIITEEGREKYFDQTVEENLKLPAEQCALLFLNHVYTDWRDVICTVNIPTLVVGAKNSHVKVANNVWTHEHIPGSELKIFETAHMMFMEEPEAFNKAVMDFID